MNYNSFISVYAGAGTMAAIPARCRLVEYLNFARKGRGGVDYVGIEN